jgi:hypothetical protein
VGSSLQSAPNVTKATSIGTRSMRMRRRARPSSKHLIGTLPSTMRRRRQQERAERGSRSLQLSRCLSSSATTTSTSILGIQALAQIPVYGSCELCNCSCSFVVSTSNYCTVHVAYVNARIQPRKSDGNVDNVCNFLKAGAKVCKAAEEDAAEAIMMMVNNGSLENNHKEMT